MRILVTGGAGFIGGHISERLLSLGHEVTVLDDLSTGKLENIQALMGHDRFHFCQGSILDLPLLRELIQNRRIERISHQAARPSVARSIEDPLATHEVNITGTLNVLKVAHEAGCRRVVAASSSSIYGNTPVLPKREDMHYRPRSPYAATKVAGELYLQVFHAVYGLQTVGLRYFNVYGPQQDPNSHYAAVIPKFVRLALNGEPLPIEGDGAQTRDFTYIDDVVEGVVRTLDTIATPDPDWREEAPDAATSSAPYRIYNIGNHSPVALLDFIAMIEKATGRKAKLELLPAQPGDVEETYADIEALKQATGFSPSTPLEEGVKRFVAWYRDYYRV